MSAAGLVWVLFSKAAAPWRAIGIAALVALVLVFVSGGKAYYAIGSVPLFMAAGAIVIDRWLARGHFRLKAAGLAIAALLSVTLIALLTLPILPVADYAKSGLASAVPDTANEIGWPEFVSTVEGVVASLPADERAHAVILTNDYSEASPLVLLGTWSATGLLGPQQLLVLGASACRPDDRGPRRRLATRGLEPVLRRLP